MTKKKKNNRKSVKPGALTVASGATQYNGPTRIPGGSEQRDLAIAPLVFTTELISTGGNQILNVFGSSPSSATPDWTSLAALYDEYRTLSIEVHYIPYDRYNRGTSVYTTSLAIVLDQDDIVPLTSYANALTYGSAKLVSLDTPWKRVMKMSGIENSVWTTTVSPVNLFCVKVYSDGLSTVTTYGRIVMYYMVQFRGRN